MTALAEQPTSGPLSSIIKATQRLNPCMEIDVDVLAVARAAVASTQADWAAGVLTSTAADTTGLLRLSPPAGVSLFSQLNAVTVNHFLQDSSNGIEEYALDFFPAPGITQGVRFTLSSLDLYLGGAQNLKGFYRVSVGYYDQNWQLVSMGDPIDILSGDVSALVGNGGVYTIDFIARGHRYTFPSGMQNTTTGSGYDGTNIRTANVDNKNVSHLLNIPRGLSISIRPSGAHATSAFIGCVANATATQFQTGSFWRVAPNRNCGPYNPVNQPYTGATTDHNPDNYLVTGAVPGFGAIAVTNGSWGIARRIPTAQRAQSAFYTWEQPYHNLKIVGYPSTGTAVNVLDMGATPTNPVELRLDDIQQAGTSLAYVLKGSNISAAGAWTAITANTDGSILSGADLYRWYQLTTTFTPGPTGATKYASPALQAWSMIERVALSTYRYLKDIDSTTVADPITAQSSIGELKVPVMNGGRQDFRDLAAQLGSAYAPSSLEAHVYARNTRSGVRYFLDSYRLENRDPQFGVEEMTFVSGMDRLTPMIPSPTETFRYPAGSGQVAITNVTNVGAVYTITVAGTPFTIAALVNFRMHSVTGVSANQDFTIVSNPTTSQFTINVASGPIPAIGDTFEIHSDQTTRVAAPYVTQDFAAVYADLLGVQAAVPARYRGRLPATTGRTGSFTIPAGGVKALDILQDVALHCGGFPAWGKGRIQYVDFYGPKDSVFVWGDREIVSLETPVGADRRMPSVRVKYNYDAGQQNFLNEATYEDNDTLLGWGRSNLFDVFELPDDFCKWNDVNEAGFVANTLQKAWKSGARLWKVKTVLCYPWLSQGDAVTILTDQYTDRRLSFSADGVTDLGVPIAGRTSSLAVIVGRNLWGNEFVVGVRGLDQITSAAVARTGTVQKPPLPTPIRSQVFDDGKFAVKASDTGGGNVDPSVVAPSLSQAGAWTSSGVTLASTAATINDGDVVTNSFHTDTAVPGAYVEVDMGVATTFDNVRIWASTAGSVAIYKVRHSPDGATWTDTTAIGFNPAYLGWNVIGFTAISKRWWRLELTNTPGPGAWNNEVEFACAQSLAIVNHRPHPVARYADMADRTNLGFDTGANLKNNVQQYDNPSANTLAKKSMKGRQAGTAYNGQAITFSTAFQNPPAMKFSRGANTITNQQSNTNWSTPASWSATLPQIEDVRASGLTATGFTQVAQLVQSSATTARVGEFTTGNSLTTAGSLTSFALTNCPSSNGHYTVRYTWSVTVTSNKPGIAATATIVVTINKRAGGASGASTELDRQTYSVTDPDGTGPYTNSSGGPQSTDINATLGNTDWLEVKITSFTHSGAILQTDSCVVHGCNVTNDGAGNDGESHTTAGTVITLDMTQNHATDTVNWEAVSWQ